MDLTVNKCSVAPSFGSIHVNSSNMRRCQRNLSNVIADIMSYSDVYTKSKDMDIDVYFLKGRSPNSVLVKFVDRFSDEFFRTKKGKSAVAVCAHIRDNVYDSADKVLRKLNEIINGKYKAPEMDVERVLGAKTDVACLKPYLYDDVTEGVDDLSKIMDIKTAREHVADNFLRANRDTINGDSEF